MATARLRHGGEGPAHDPYGYTEVTFTRTDGLSVTWHGGLAEWTEVGVTNPRKGFGKRRGVFRVAEGDEAAEMFEAVAGIGIAEASRLAERIENPHRCPKCRRKHPWIEVDGFPGETLTICEHCDAVGRSRVNWAAIE